MVPLESENPAVKKRIRGLPTKDASTPKTWIEV